MKRRIKLVSLICALVFFVSANLNLSTVLAASAENDVSSSTTTIESDSDEYTYIIEVTEYPTDSGVARAAKTKTASKTMYCQNAAGETMWLISITADFRYTGSTSTCTHVSASAKSFSSGWSVTAPTYNRSGNKGWATATATNSKLKKTDTQTITITCSKNGAIS